MRRSIMLEWVALIVVIIVILILLFLRAPQAVQAACYPVPVGANTPTGIAGCEVWGRGIASHYGPGGGVAMNFCTWTYRHRHGCGDVRITSLDTGRTVRVPVVDYCDCYTGTRDQRVVDVQYGVLAALGLDPAQGLYPVEVWPVDRSKRTPPAQLPDTAMHGG